MKYIPASIFFYLGIGYFNTADITWNTEGKKRERCFRICLDDFCSPVDTAAQHRSSRNPKVSVSGTGVSLSLTANEHWSVGQEAPSLLQAPTLGPCETLDEQLTSLWACILNCKVSL